MQQEQSPHPEPSAEPLSEGEAQIEARTQLDTGKELDAAREADAAWRAANKARFAGPLARLKRWTGVIELWLGTLAISTFVLGFALILKNPRATPYLPAGAYCMLAFLVLAVLALSFGALSRWLQRHIRALAAAAAVELDE